MPCYTTPVTELYAADIDDSSGTTYFAAFGTNQTMKFTFLPPAGGSVTSVSVSPTGAGAPTCGSDYVLFGTAHIDNQYTVTINYTTSTREADARGGDGIVHPLDTPTKFPTFKPVVRCP